MKRNLFKTVSLVLSAFVFFSCGTTSGVDTSKDSVNSTAETENPLTHIIDQNQNPEKRGIFNTTEALSPDAEIVSDEDKNLNKVNSSVPVSDEKNKVSEPEIFDSIIEPEVKDLEENTIPVLSSPSDGILLSGPVTETQIGIRKTVEKSVKDDNTNIQIEPEVQSVADDYEAAENDEIKEAAKASEITENTSAEKSHSQIEISSDENNEKAIKAYGEEKNTASETDAASQVEETKAIIPSRSVTMKKNQFMDVVYPGTGWVYIGETEEPFKLRYFGRKIGTGNTTFSLRSLNEGETILHFYKNDALTGEFIDDYLAVTVLNEKAKSAARVTAPSYANIVPAKPARRTAQTAAAPKTQETAVLSAPEAKAAEKEEIKQEIYIPSDTESKKEEALTTEEASLTASKTIDVNDNVKTVISTPQSALNEPDYPLSSPSRMENPDTTSAISISSASEVISDEKNKESPLITKEIESLPADESLLQKARDYYNAKRYPESLVCCQAYINGADKKLDEAYFLLAQNYEAESPVKNIRNAVDAYETVTKRYPLSKLWKQANQKTIYLKRFYIDIR